MRTGIVALALVVLLVWPAPPVHAVDYYRVSVSRVESNVYREEYSGVIIVTEFCLELAVWDNALLAWDSLSPWLNKLHFSNGRSCEVKSIYRR